MHSQTFQGLPCRQSLCQVAGIANKKSFCFGTGQLPLLETHKNASGIQCYQRPQLPGSWVALNKHGGGKIQVSVKEAEGQDKKQQEEKGITEPCRRRGPSAPAVPRHSEKQQQQLCIQPDTSLARHRSTRQTLEI